MTTGEKVGLQNTLAQFRFNMPGGGPRHRCSDHSQGSMPAIRSLCTMVAPGGATVVEFKVDVPGNYTLVDHALSRAEKGLAGTLVVTGDENPDIFRSDEPVDPKSGH